MRPIFILLLTCALFISCNGQRLLPKFDLLNGFGYSIGSYDDWRLECDAKDTVFLLFQSEKVASIFSYAAAGVPKRLSGIIIVTMVYDSSKYQNFKKLVAWKKEHRFDRFQITQ